MRRSNGLIGLSILVVVGVWFGYVFLFERQEKRYSEILVNLKRGEDLGVLQSLAKEHGFKIRKHKFIVGPNEFTKQNRIVAIYKYDLDPARLNRILAALGRLRAEGRVVNAVEPNFLVKSTAPAAPVNDPLYPKQWNLVRLGMEQVWKKADGSGVTVAVIDTGVSRNLPDLNPSRFVNGHNFVAGNADFEDDNGHGSHVAGTIAQDTNNGVGVAGVAPKAKIMPLKVLSREGSGSTLAIAEAIVWAVDHGAHVINMSSGGGGYTKARKDTCDYAHRKGVVVVAAAGNESDGSSAYPGPYSTVLSVSAANQRDLLAPYSNYGEGVDLIAPGGDTSSSR